jgi:hypothetical protein
MTHLRTTPTKNSEFLEVFEELIDHMVIENEDSLLDDDYPDTMADPEKRQEAFGRLLDLLSSEGYEI